ncbi:transposase [Sphingomonas sp. S1-29]|uniref:RNA-guided endonuclease InsQ/TnpB family protein n=1 Tax=Sphingomonas sp. S1-29 TaxID=2991074 RepID=UPI00223FEE55|nr:transposase [Sphingomonas sp. S1-29]UZK68850.1 transposase [Sphingomonas sp. S1-29]
MGEAMPSVRIESLAGLPRRKVEALRLGRVEAGKVWTLCRDLHLDARKSSSYWPKRDDLQKATKGLFALHSQTVQMITHAFLANVETARQLRLKGNAKMRYPYKDKHYYPLMWPKQAVSLTTKTIILPMGRGRSSIVLPRPDWLTAPAACQIVWNGIEDQLHIVVEGVAVTVPPGTNHATVDLGQIHQAAVVADNGKALIVSGRGIRSEKRGVNMMHGKVAKLQSKCTKGSRRHRKLGRTRRKLAARTERRIRDMRHKGTRQVIDFCVANEVGSVFIGNPHGVRRRPCGRKHNQRMSQWEYGKDITYLEQKAKKACISSFTGSERGTSSQCPECSARKKAKGRRWTCKSCGFSGHRELVGAANMHPIAFGEKVAFPSLQDTTYQRPVRFGGLGSCSRSDTSRGKSPVAVFELNGQAPDLSVTVAGTRPTQSAQRVQC